MKINVSSKRVVLSLIKNAKDGIGLDLLYEQDHCRRAVVLFW